MYKVGDWIKIINPDKDMESRRDTIMCIIRLSSGDYHIRAKLLGGGKEFLLFSHEVAQCRAPESEWYE